MLKSPKLKILYRIFLVEFLASGTILGLPRMVNHNKCSRFIGHVLVSLQDRPRSFRVFQKDLRLCLFQAAKDERMQSNADV